MIAVADTGPINYLILTGKDDVEHPFHSVLGGRILAQAFSISSAKPQASFVGNVSSAGQRCAFRSEGDLVVWQVLKFAAVTITGAYVLHVMVLKAGVSAFGSAGIGPTNLAKSIAMASGIAWNFGWFRRVVFSSRQ